MTYPHQKTTEPVSAQFWALTGLINQNDPPPTKKTGAYIMIYMMGEENKEIEYLRYVYSTY